MCHMCEENDGEPIGCPDCGRMICFDFDRSNFDVQDRAYVTSYGDVFCTRCGVRYDIEENEDDEYDDGFDYY